MTQKLIIRNLLLGFLSWLIPFAVSFLFYKPGGALVGCYLLIKYFKITEGDFIKNGIIVGLSWFAINIILDVVILIPIMKSTFTDYFMSIGIAYFSIPAISIAMGSLLKIKSNIHANK